MTSANKHMVRSHRSHIHYTTSRNYKFKIEPIKKLTFVTQSEVVK
jgi:hypothetical protein